MDSVAYRYRMSHPVWLRRVLSVFLLLTPAGRSVAQGIDELALAPGSGPAGLAVDSDGDIWFAEETGNRVGRLSASAPTLGSPTEYALPNPDSRPHGVTGASDGILFTEGAGRTGHITADRQDCGRPPGQREVLGLRRRADGRIVVPRDPRLRDGTDPPVPERRRADAEPRGYECLLIGRPGLDIVTGA
jgi:hypothetical protein